MEWLRNKITRDTAINYEWPSWTPDDDKIMSNCRFADGQKRICVLNLLDGEEELLGNGTVSGDQPKWSPKGDSIALERGKSIFVIRSDGSDERKISDIERLGFWLDIRE